MVTLLFCSSAPLHLQFLSVYCSSVLLLRCSSVSTFPLFLSSPLFLSIYCSSIPLFASVPLCLLFLCGYSPPLFLCAYSSSVPTVPLFFCTFCSSLPTVPLHVLFVSIYRSSVSLFVCPYYSPVPLYIFHLLYPVLLWLLFLCTCCYSVPLLFLGINLMINNFSCRYMRPGLIFAT